MPLTAIKTSNLDTTNSLFFRNRIINGACVIDQRNAGASTTPGSGQSYSLDRWSWYGSAGSKVTIQQNAGSVTPPPEFTNYAGVTSTAATSLGASDIYLFYQWLEGFNTADFDFGKSTAKTVTISFWVRSSLTGTFGGVLQNAAQNRNYPFTYSIPTSNTWTKIAITIPGDTTGTWVGATNGQGMGLIFSLGSGSSYSTTANAWTATSAFAPTGAVSVVGTSGATWYVTGIQLEASTAATAFEYRPFTTELQLCQRYYEKCYPQNIVPGTSGYQYAEYTTCTYNNNTGYIESTFKFQVMKRAAPTMTAYDSAGNSGRSSYYVNGSLSNDKSITFGGAGPTDYKFYFYSDNTTSKGGMAFGWTASAEL
jgi:hypothetical protein